METNTIIIAISALIVITILIYNPAKTYGVPAALLFILSGFFIGNGKLTPAFNYPEATELISQFAISIIIFNGGLNTKISAIKPVIAEGLMLSNVGVLLTSLGLGYLVSLITPLNLLEGMLLGSIVAATDAATTFSIIESKKLKLKSNTDKVLEFESATNDPIALIMTLLFANLLLDGGKLSIGSSLLFFGQQILIGSLFAGVVAILIRFLLKRIKFAVPGLTPIMLLASLFGTTLFADKFGGNILLASYIMGVVIGNTDFDLKSFNTQFFDSFGWLAQALMFVLLGLQIYPEHLLEVIGIGVVISVLLFFIIRPLSVMLSYLPFKQPLNKKLFVSWMGIKGATPIVFALIPLTMNVPNSEIIFNISVVIVLLSMIIHGFSFGWTAKKMKIID